MLKVKRCPWGGLPCDCKEFPWIKDGVIPKRCEDQMPEALLGIRKVSDRGKQRYVAYVEEMERSRRNGHID